MAFEGKAQCEGCGGSVQRAPRDSDGSDGGGREGRMGKRVEETVPGCVCPA